MIEAVASGVYAYMPLAVRSLKKIEAIIRDEMDRAGGQEAIMPVLHPLELWQKSGRDKAFGENLFRLKDRRGHDLVLGPTHEEVLADIVGRNVSSYRDLPLLIYQIQTKFRDEPRPRGGLLRVREFAMKDLYSFDIDEAGLNISYQKMLTAYHNIFRRCGLPAVMVEADSGAIGGKESHEFMLIAASGEDEVVRCLACGYAANREKASLYKGNGAGDPPLPVEEITTPGKTTIAEVADYLGIPALKTLKVVFYVADGKVIAAAIRGDLEINEVKLKNQLGAIALRLATPAEIEPVGAVTGFASPVGLTRVKVVADDSVVKASNLVAGANRPGYHLKNVNYLRDFQADIVADISLAGEGDPCPHCQNRLEIVRAIEVGHTFKLGTFISEKIGAYYTDPNGNRRPIVMGSYGIGVGRLLAAAVEQNHDDKGITWPRTIAPYGIIICPLHLESSTVSEATHKLCAELDKIGLEALVDDREESAGVKFNDADLLGIPLRVTLSPRTLKEGNAEIKWRQEKTAALYPLKGLAEVLGEMLNGAQHTSPLA